MDGFPTFRGVVCGKRRFSMYFFLGMVFLNVLFITYGRKLFWNDIFESFEFSSTAFWEESFIEFSFFW